MGGDGCQSQNKLSLQDQPKTNVLWRGRGRWICCQRWRRWKSLRSWRSWNSWRSWRSWKSWSSWRSWNLLVWTLDNSDHSRFNLLTIRPNSHMLMSYNIKLHYFENHSTRTYPMFVTCHKQCPCKKSVRCIILQIGRKLFLFFVILGCKIWHKKLQIWSIHMK